MNVLLIKTSSLGDLVHAFPALTDAHGAIAGLTLDWVVEEAFVPVAQLHPGVRDVIPVALRRWRRERGGVAEMHRFLARLRGRRYDLVLDAQGLIKSAFIASLARGPVSGFDRGSARESLASLVYRHGCSVPRDQHAIDRLRALFAAALGYPPASARARSGLQRRPHGDRLVFLHGTSWANKLWPEPFWRDLAQRATEAGIEVLLPWGTAGERERAQRIAAGTGAVVADAMSLAVLIDQVAMARGVVTVDSGLGHLAAAFGVPTVAVFGPTDVARTGCRGDAVVNLAATLPCAPCMARTCSYRGPALGWRNQTIEPACFAVNDPEQVFRALMALQ